MSRKIIAIPGWSTGEGSFGITKTYGAYLSQFGTVEILSPRTDVVKCDLLVLPGGMDIDPTLYGQVPAFYTGNIDTAKNAFFKVNLPQYVAAKVPIFGICLGIN